MRYATPFRGRTSHADWWRIAAWLAVTFAWSSLAWAETGPGDTVVELHEGLLGAAQFQARPWSERYGALEPLVRKTHDLSYIGKFTIRRQWPALTSDQQRDFADAFETLAVSNYVSRFGGLGDASFEILQEQALTRGRFQVDTMLRPSAADPVSLQYVLHQDADGLWRIINVVANDVSDLALKRAEYQRILRQGNFPDLLEELRQQAVRLEN